MSRRIERKLAFAVLFSILFSLLIAHSVQVNAEILPSGDYRYTPNYDNQGKIISVNIVDYKNKSAESVSVPSTIDAGGERVPVVSIRYCTFRDATKLRKVTIPETVTELDYGVFYGCTSLTSVNIPKNVKSFGEFCFAYCESLTTLPMNNSIKSIPQNCFYDCKGLTSITIPGNVTEIQEGAFADCVNLASVTLGVPTKNIGQTAFFHCKYKSTVYKGSAADLKKMSISNQNSEILNSRVTLTESPGITGTVLQVRADVNNDNVFDISDATYAQKYLSGIIGDDVIISDLNSDGKVNIKDITRMRKILAKNV